MTIEEQMLLLKESFDSVGTKLNGLTWQRIEKSHLEFSQSQTQELIEQNAELVSLVQRCWAVIHAYNNYNPTGTGNEILKSIQERLTKYNHLKSNTNG